MTIAARLAEFASVAIVEAGGFYEVDYGNASVIPLLSLTAMDFIDTSEAFPRRPQIDWELLSVPQAEAGNRFQQWKTVRWLMASIYYRPNGCDEILLTDQLSELRDQQPWSGSVYAQLGE